MAQITVGQPGFGEVTVLEAGTREVHVVEPCATEIGTHELHAREAFVQNGAVGKVDALQGLDGFFIVQYITSISLGMKKAVTGLVNVIKIRKVDLTEMWDPLFSGF